MRKVERHKLSLDLLLAFESKKANISGFWRHLLPFETEAALDKPFFNFSEKRREFSNKNGIFQNEHYLILEQFAHNFIAGYDILIEKKFPNYLFYISGESSHCAGWGF